MDTEIQETVVAKKLAEITYLDEVFTKFEAVHAIIERLCGVQLFIAIHLYTDKSL